ncbi:U7 snRNA-associated Sm-like protein LSm10 [Anoplophora glabripennis]|nr:U7 snRNA-associated Sm-like protein LSm10 [Anoplophora glabripennis]
MAENTDEVIVKKKTLTKEDKFFFYNSLAGLVKALEGQYTTIDLRNESCVTGKITFIDGHMNIEMEDVVFYDARGTERVFPNFFISQRNVRYVHLPKKTSATELIDKQFEKMASKKHMTKEHTFKKVRAKRYNEEIVKSAFSGETSSA